MVPTSSLLGRAAFYLAFGCAAASLFSIAVSQILLALALAALLMSEEKLRFPPIDVPLTLFIVGTNLSLILSPDPWAGRPQLRKLFVFLVLFVAASTFRNADRIRNLMLAWIGIAALSSAWSFVQLYRKYEDARRLGVPLYEHLMEGRITGFMSHWMTLGGQQMMILLVAGAFLFFSPSRRRWLWPVLAAAGVIWASMVLGFTRSIIYFAAPAGAIWLLWFWRRWLLIAVPALLALVLLLGPPAVRARFTSIFRPRDQVDSNQHRLACWRAGAAMIRAHPWFGVGPEMVGKRFDEFAPKERPRGWYGHLHNIYLQYAAERGIPTLLALLWLVGKVLWDFTRALRRAPPGPSEEKFILHGAVAVVIGVLVEGVFEYNLGDSEVLLVFLAIVACGYRAKACLER